jgi:hypothetical protein
MLKKFLFSLLVLCAFSPLVAQNLSGTLPLLQKNTRTAAENRKVLQIFRSAKDPDTIFAAGASLVKIPPTKEQEPAVMSLVLRQNEPLKSTFAAIIITAMGSHYEELLPLLENALGSKDDVLRAYTAGAYSILNPADKTYADEVVRLYIFDDKFSQRALHLLDETPEGQLKLLKKASVSTDAQIRAAAAMWLGNAHTDKANQILLKMAKTEKDASVQTQLATSLAKNQSEVLAETAKGLKKNYQNSVSTTYALALGFMTGYSVSTLRQTLVSKNENERINTLRALAYMANVLSNPDAFAYSSDRTFDISLLKSFIPQLTLLSKTGNETERTYAQNALLQLEKLM